jgi:hypothetical protein
MKHNVKISCNFLGLLYISDTWHSTICGVYLGLFIRAYFYVKDVVSVMDFVECLNKLKTEKNWKLC